MQMEYRGNRSDPASGPGERRPLQAQVRSDEDVQRWTQPVELVETLHVPVLVIRGTEDRAFPLSNGTPKVRGVGERARALVSSHEDLPITKGLALGGDSGICCTLWTQRTLTH